MRYTQLLCRTLKVSLMVMRTAAFIIYLVVEMLGIRGIAAAEGGDASALHVLQAAV